MKPIAFAPNPRRMGYRELFRVAGKPMVGFLACGLKLFRLIGPMKDGYGMRSFGDQLDRFDIDSLPRHVLKETKDYMADLEDLGFIPRFAYSVTSYGAQEAHGLLHRHKTGVAAASVAYARCVRDDNETLTTVFGFNTPLADDTYLITMGCKRLMSKPNHFLSEYMPGASPKAVFERHIERLEKADALPRTIKTDDELERLVLGVETDDTEFNLERGVYVRMSREEIELGEELKEEYERSGGSGGAADRPKKRKKKDDDDDEDEDEVDEEDEEEEDRDDEDDEDDDEDDDYR